VASCLMQCTHVRAPCFLYHDYDTSGQFIYGPLIIDLVTSLGLLLGCNLNSFLYTSSSSDHEVIEQKNFSYIELIYTLIENDFCIQQLNILMKNEFD
jgi:hypothetical protein